MYYYVRQYGGRLFVRDIDGDRIVTKYPFHLYFQHNKADGKYRSIDGKKLKRQEFGSVSALNKHIKDLREISSGAFIYGQNRADYQYIYNEYRNAAPPDDIRVVNVDIEVEKDKENGYCTVEEATNPINAITAKYDGHFFAWALADYEPHIPNVDYVKCATEKELLARFIHFMETTKPHIITGWNSKYFDFPYLVNRGKQIVGEDHLNRMSPYGIIYDFDAKTPFGQRMTVYDIVGIQHLDYLDLYMKFTYSARESYTLDNIAHIELKEKKLDYSEYENLQDLADKNPQKFVEYNIKDVDLVDRLDGKMKLIDLITGLAYMTGTNFEDIFSPVKTWDVFIYNKLADHGFQIPTIMEKKKKDSIIGAFVQEIKPGRRNWVVSFDLASLYPHLQMQYNISPEMLIEPEDYTPEMTELKSKMPKPILAVDLFVDRKFDLGFLKDQNATITPNGQFYRCGQDGFIPQIIEGLYNQRKATKQEMLKLKQLEQDTGEKHTNAISSLDNKQKAFKILMNSEYGAMANKYFRWFDTRNAEAITSSGQLSIKWIARDLNAFMNRFLKTEGIEYSYYSDTDSVYITMDEIVQKYFKDIPDAKIVDALNKFAEDKIQPAIDESYQALADYVNAHKQKMVMKREIIANRSVHTGKKRYIMNVLDDEGVRLKEPKLKMMGIEAVKSSTPEICRDAIKEVVRLILQGEEADVHKYVKEFKEKFYKAPVEEIANPRGVNGIEKWDDGNGVCKKGTPINVRGAIVYNHLLDKKNLVDYNAIKSGDKIRYCYLKEPNETGGNVICFPNYLPSELRFLEASVDRDMQFEKAFISPIKTLLEACSWNYEKKITIDDFF